MNLRLVRNDAAFRASPAWALLAGLNAGVVSGLLVTAALGRAASPSAGTIALAIWLSVGVFLVAGPVTTRATEHELALPVSGRRLWLHHALAVLVGCLLIVGVGAALLGLLAAVAALRGPARLPVAAPAALAAAASLLAVVLIEAAARGEAELAGRWRHRAWRVAVVLAIAAAVVLAGGAPWAAALALLALAAIGGAVVLRGVPPALALVPRAPVAAPRRDARRGMDAAADGTALRRRAPLAPLLFRWLPPFSRYGWLVFAALLGFLLAGGAGALSEDPDLAGMRLFYLYLVAYMLMSINGPLLRPLRFADPLPLPRRQVFARLFAPPLAGIAAGIAAGSVVQTVSFGVLALELALVVTLWLLALAALLTAYRPGVPGAVRQTLYWGPLALALIVPLRSLVLGMSRRTRPFAVEAGLEAAAAALMETPAGALALGLGAAALVAFAGWLALRQFRRMEIPARAVRYELVEWATEDR
jgi:hypothetical protein